MKKISHQAARPNTAEVSVRYIGQVGFLLNFGGLNVAIDPFLTDSLNGLPGFPPGMWVRNYPPPVALSALSHLDLVLCTHDHMDHADPETLAGIAKAAPRCHFAGPRLTVREMERMGLPKGQLTVLNEGTPFKFRDLTVEPVAAAHEDYVADEKGFHRYLGYLLHWQGLTLFHAGDTIVTSRLFNALKSHAIDIGFLPINGRDAHRNRFEIVGNMGSGEAVQFASWLAGGKGFNLLVPTHYDLYPQNGASVADFVEAWDTASEPKPGFKVFRPGEEIVYRKPVSS